MGTYDLYQLEDDVLFKSNDSFYDFVQDVCGKVEADILRVQGIRNARSLIRSTNLLDILKLDCDEVDVIKADACFECKGGDLVIKQGIKLNLDNLLDALKEKHEKYKKKSYHQQQPQAKLPHVILAPTAPIINSNNSNDSATQNSDMATTTGTASTITLSNTSTINASSFVSNNSTINEHINFINDLIDKFSRKTFVSVVLKQHEHYELYVTRDDQSFKAVIKCQCGTKLMLPLRSEPSRFILSNFYSHLTTSTCSVVARIFKEEKKSNNKQLESQSISTPASRSQTTASSSNNSNLAQQSKRKHNDDSLTTNSNSTKSKKQKR